MFVRGEIIKRDADSYTLYVAGEVLADWKARYIMSVASEIIADWKARGITKPRNILPANGHAAELLRHIRHQACRASGVRNCLVWSKDKPEYDSDYDRLFANDEVEISYRYKRGTYRYKLGTNPCTQCKTMGISLLEFSEALWGIKNTGREAGELVVDESDLRSWMNGRKPVPPHRLIAVIGIALKRRWMGRLYAQTWFHTIADHEAICQVTKKLMKRLLNEHEVLNEFRRSNVQAEVEAELDAMERAARDSLVEKGRRLGVDYTGLDIDALDLIDELKWLEALSSSKICSKFAPMNPLKSAKMR